MSGGAAAYFSGHEHVFQHHTARGVSHFVCGASGAQETRLYNGADPDAAIDWVDDSDAFGFLAVTVAWNHMTVRFVQADGSVLKEVVVPHGGATSAGDGVIGSGGGDGRGSGSSSGESGDSSAASVEGVSSGR